MINRNLELKKDSEFYYLKLSGIDNHELDILNYKYAGKVNVIISKPISPGSEMQNAAMHALLSEYFKTGMHSAPGIFGETLTAFKIWIKMQYGPCYCLDMDGNQIKVPKSWSNYTKQERMELIDGLIAEINSSGAYAESEKLREIIEGMQGIK